MFTEKEIAKFAEMMKSRHGRAFLEFLEKNIEKYKDITTLKEANESGLKARQETILILREAVDFLKRLSQPVKSSLEVYE